MTPKKLKLNIEYIGSKTKKYHERDLTGCHEDNVSHANAR